jgi:hypothetical protein
MLEQDPLPMGLRIGRHEAEVIFGKALDLAKSSEPLPAEWLERTRKVATAKSKTFTPVLATALLAKATDRRVDAFSLREGAGHKSYSARNLAKEVLVPQCVAAGINIRSTGAEPLNNQPFFHAERIGPDINVRPNAREDLLYLCECLERADFLEDEDAVRAFAAFLRVRLEASAKEEKIEVGGRRLTVEQLEQHLDAFADEDPDGGKTGQALGAAILDLVFADVRAKRVNDPSVKWPGDVGVFAENELAEAVEVRQKPISQTDVLLFAQHLEAAGVRRGIMLAFAKTNEDLDVDALRRQAREVYQVELAVFFRPGALLREALRWAPRDVPFALKSLPVRGMARLTEIEASASRRKAWAAMFSEDAAR